MTPHDFTYWLQGFAELNQAPPTAEQWQAIRDHLATVFNKVTPMIPATMFPGPAGTPLRPLRSECSTGTNHSSGIGILERIGKDG